MVSVAVSIMGRYGKTAKVPLIICEHLQIARCYGDGAIHALKLPSKCLEVSEICSSISSTRTQFPYSWSAPCKCHYYSHIQARFQFVTGPWSKSLGMSTSRQQIHTWLPRRNTQRFIYSLAIRMGIPYFIQFVCSMPQILCGLVVRVLGYRSGGPGSIPGTTRKKSSGSGTGSTQPREYNWGATW
jgi:hypothetical protein